MVKKVECPKCEGKGCNHCDDTGYHTVKEYGGPKMSKAEYLAYGKKYNAKQKTEACWKGYKAKGMKKKGDKMVPNCVPEEAGMTDVLKGYPEQEKMKIAEPFKLPKTRAQMARESHYSVGDKVVIDGKAALVVHVDPADKGKYYTVKYTDGQSGMASPDQMKKLSESVKTIKVGADAIGAESTHHALVKERKVVKTGSKEDMLKACEEEGGRVWVTASQVGDIVESTELTEATSKKLRDKMKELAGGQLPRSSMELRKLKAKAQAELKKGREAKRNTKSTTKTSTGKLHTGSMDKADRNIIMQLRKAQDLGGKHDILVSPKGRTVRLPKQKIDQLLKSFDNATRPQEKRRFQIMLTKALRDMARKQGK